MQQIIEHNLKIMTDKSAGGMTHLFRQESMGGNASIWGPYSCVGLNFSYNPINGKIFIFTNSQPRKKKLSRGCYRAAVKMVSEREFKLRIINISLENDASTKAKINLKLSVKEFNKIYAFKLSRTEKIKSLFWK